MEESPKGNRDSSLDMWEKALTQFQEAARLEGWSSPDWDKNAPGGGKYIFNLEKLGSASRSVSLKSRKRISREESSKQDDWQWIELKGVGKNNPGWLFDERISWIVFETLEDFVIVDRQKLIGFVKQMVKLDAIVENAADAKYRVYTRKGRYDAITLVETTKLRELAEHVWKK